MDARTSRYHEVYARSLRDPQGIPWGEAAQAIDWIEQPKQVFDPSVGVYGRWFVDGVCNTCYNALDRHVHAGRGDRVALIYDLPVTDNKCVITYDRVLTETRRWPASCAISASPRATASSSTCRWCRRR